ncbi:ATP-dependent DNA helicase RecQ [Oceanobacillus zhaokaii]|uniref:DNA 3'-5' helicase n=1 Tax=Oceanobacillus zhaokaii TaxID=2052660 RepID=A0A345PEL5_9BACI|nr:RecQ family ATP-dependent DNA helicase [Oceanobacillus zhaokaii]AXI08445.1 ATP-dependent DNA helicase RecQ [Oceanobacillus zhaokaii]
MDSKVEQLFESYFPNLADKFSLRVIQKTATQNLLDGNNTLCIMPTSGGKSLIYWLSGLSLQGITIVISPLIALIDEQASKISEQGYEVLTIHGGISPKKQVDLLKKLANKELNPKFIFISPERMATDGLFEYGMKKRKEDINLIAIDEIHCVSQWGVSFRPFYRRIPEFLNSVFNNNWPRVLGLTATLNANEIKDICSSFHISRKNIIKDHLLVRSEIELKKIKFTNEDEKEEKLWDLLRIHRNEKVLVYLYRKYNKRGTEDLMKTAIEKGYNAVNFHGEMSAKARQEIIQKFKNNDVDVIFATNAFGMGIDIPDIRVVIHFMIPESVEQYYQEVGRAARDGEASNTYLLYTNKNIRVKKTHFIDRSFPSIDKLKDVFKKITGNKTNYKTLPYFNDEDVQLCLPYYLDNDILEIGAKGITTLDIFSEIKDPEIERLYNLTRTKGFISTVKKSGHSPKEVSDKVYSAIINEQVNLSKNLDKSLIVRSKYTELKADQIKILEQYIEDKRTYKHKLLDYFTYLLEVCENSRELHQEIGRYLGVDKHNLNKIYRTRKGDLVRSKSEVIIANLLYEANVNYEYEKKLYYDDQNWIEPDFTIEVGEKDIYWEHLGMIGTETYDKRWLKKIDIYEKYYPDQLEITYENPALSDSARNIIEKIKVME